MADIFRPSELPAAASVASDEAIPTDNGLAVRKATPVQIVNAGRPVASEPQALAGVSNATAMTPLRVRQVLDSGLVALVQPYIDLAEAWATKMDGPPDVSQPMKMSSQWNAERAQSIVDTIGIMATPETFGAVGDGVADDTEAVRRFFDYAQDVFPMPVGARVGVYRLTSTIEILRPIRFLGTMPQPVESVFTGPDAPNRKGPGTWFHFDHDDEGFIFGGANSPNPNPNERNGGGVFVGFGYFQNQPEVIDSGWEPNEYPFAIDFQAVATNHFTDWDIGDIVPLNPYRGIRIARMDGASGGGVGGIRLFNIKGQPLFEGIHIDNSVHVMEYRDICLWPYWAIDAPVLAWTKANGTGFVFGRADNHKIFNSFAYGYKNPMRLVNSAVEDPNWSSPSLTLYSFGFDDVGDVGLLVEADKAYIEMHGCTGFNGAHGIKITGDDNIVKMIGGRLRNNTGAAMVVEGEGNILTLDAPSIIDWGSVSNNVPAVVVDADNFCHVAGDPDFMFVSKMYRGIRRYGGAGNYSTGRDRVSGGVFAGSTDANGRVTIPHNLTGLYDAGLALSAISTATYNCRGNAAQVGRGAQVFNLTGDNLIVQTLAPDGTALPESSTVQINWRVELFA